MSSEELVSRNLTKKGIIIGDSYLSSYNETTNEEHAKEKYRELLKYAPILNEHLHSIKVKESQRSLLISGILIALENDYFKSGYEKINEPQRLADQLVDTIESELVNALVKTDKAKNLSVVYSFIKTQPALSKEKNTLKNLISDVNNKIGWFMQNCPGYDILGQFYIEFLKYANNDKGLGIVLTPPHITELFSDIAMVNKDSIVLDNCTGTGGFLISAMKKMIKDAKGNIDKIEEIRRNQLVGIEYQDDIFALACSNMYIHGDGKNGIEHGSCFDKIIMNRVVTHKPNVGFLNPPYRSSENDPYEFQFILNNLSMLEKGGTCVAIVPMSCVLALSGKEKELKDEILKNHTLEAVFSMPDELFTNSNVSVVTSVVVIKAHYPHPEGYETYFGYYKDDGFIKRKPYGRQDHNGVWESKKEQWINSFKNRKEIPGLSVKKCITSEDEWCAEAYMETDYSDISQDEFLQSVKNFIIYKNTKVG